MHAMPGARLSLSAAATCSTAIPSLRYETAGTTVSPHRVTALRTAAPRQALQPLVLACICLLQTTAVIIMPLAACPSPVTPLEVGVQV